MTKYSFVFLFLCASLFSNFALSDSVTLRELEGTYGTTPNVTRVELVEEGRTLKLTYGDHFWPSKNHIVLAETNTCISKEVSATNSVVIECLGTSKDNVVAVQIDYSRLEKYIEVGEGRLIPARNRKGQAYFVPDYFLFWSRGYRVIH